MISQNKFFNEMEKKEREKGNEGRKEKGASRTENDCISDDNYEIEVGDESSEEEIEDNEPVKCNAELLERFEPTNSRGGCIY